MPVRIPSTLPAVEELRLENIFVIDEQRASSQDIRPLRIGILNLMPLKLRTETDLLRLISNTPLQVELDLVLPDGHEWTNTPKEHHEEFYKAFDDIRNNNYDGIGISWRRFLTGRRPMSPLSCIFAGLPLPDFITTTASPSMCSTIRFPVCFPTLLPSLTILCFAASMMCFMCPTAATAK